MALDFLDEEEYRQWREKRKAERTTGTPRPPEPPVDPWQAARMPDVGVSVPQGPAIPMPRAWAPTVPSGYVSPMAESAQPPGPTVPWLLQSARQNAPNDIGQAMRDAWLGSREAGTPLLTRPDLVQGVRQAMDRDIGESIFETTRSVQEPALEGLTWLGSRGVEGTDPFTSSPQELQRAWQERGEPFPGFKGGIEMATDPLNAIPGSVIGRAGQAVREATNLGLAGRAAAGVKAAVTAPELGRFVPAASEAVAEVPRQVVPAASIQDVSKGAQVAKQPWERTANDIETLYPRIGETVDGRQVGSSVKNMGSIDASIDNPTVLKGIREVPMGMLDTSPPQFYSASEEARTRALAEKIRQSGRIDPLIVIDDAQQGPYILEGGHRFDALKLLGAKSFPAKIVVDEDAYYNAAKQALAEGKPVPPEVMAEYPDLAKQGGRVAGEAITEAPKAAEAVPARRFYHGTGSTFDAPDAAKFDPNGKMGPGYYLTDNPEVASSYATGSKSIIATAERRRLESQLADAQREVDRVIPSPLKGRLEPIRDSIKAKLDALGPEPGPQVRAVSVPQDLPLYPANDLPVGQDVMAAIANALPEGQRASFEIRANNLRWATPRGTVTGEQLYDLLADVANSKANANATLRAAGFDGLSYPGGRHMPLLDAQGRAIEHEALVVFPESLPKITNAISGTPMGSVPEVGGAVVGALATPEDPNATPMENLLRRAAGATAGAGVGYAGRRLGSKSRLGGTIEDVTKGTPRKLDAQIAQVTGPRYDVARTSVKQIPALFRRIPWRQGDVNLDLGGGRFDVGSQALQEKGVKNLVLDPFNRPAEHNALVMQRLKEQPADTATLANVLNVIQNPQARIGALKQAAELVRPQGKVYIAVYEGDRSAIGKTTGLNTWQENRHLATYLDEVRQVFPDARLEGNYIVAARPTELPQAVRDRTFPLYSPPEVGAGLVGAATQYDPEKSPEQNARDMALGFGGGVATMAGVRAGAKQLAKPEVRAAIGRGIREGEEGAVGVPGEGAAGKRPPAPQPNTVARVGLAGAGDPVPSWAAQSNAFKPEAQPYAAEWVRTAARNNKLGSRQMSATWYSADHVAISGGATERLFLQEALGRPVELFREGWLVTADEAAWLGFQRDAKKAFTAEDLASHVTTESPASVSPPAPPAIEPPALNLPDAVGTTPAPTAAPSLTSAQAKVLGTARAAFEKGRVTSLRAWRAEDGTLYIERGTGGAGYSYSRTGKDGTVTSGWGKHEGPAAGWEQVEDLGKTADQATTGMADASAPRGAGQLSKAAAPQGQTGSTPSPRLPTSTTGEGVLPTTSTAGTSAPPSGPPIRIGGTTILPPPEGRVPTEFQFNPGGAERLGRAVQQFWDRARNVIESQGEAGKKLGGMLQQTRDRAETLAGGWVLEMPTVRRLDKAEFDNFVDVAEGRAQATSPRVAQAASEWAKVREKVYQQARAAGMDVGHLEDYFPHRYDPAMFRGEAKTKALDHLVSTGQAKDLEEAELMLRFRNDVMRSRRAGNLEIPRITDLPGYDRTKNALLGYVESAANRIAQFGVLGDKDSKAMALISQMRRQGYDADAAKNLFDISVGAKKYGEYALAMSRWARAYSTFTKLGLGALTNASQSVNTATVTGGIRTLLNTPRALFSKEAKDFALEAGVTLDGVIRNLRENSGWAGRVGDIGAPGFSQVEKFNRALAAVAGRDYARSMAAKATNGNKGALTALETMGLDGTAIAKRGGKLTSQEEIKAARSIVERTQFKVDPQDLPGWVDSPLGKVIAQFRTFSYNQTAFIGREIIQPALHGNMKPLIRFLVYGLPVGAAEVELQNYLRQRPSEEDPVQAIRQYYQRIGGIGVLGEALAGVAPPNSKYLPGERYALQAASLAAGPTIGTALEGIGSVPSALQGKPENMQRFVLKQTPVVGQTMKNMVLPYKPGGRSGSPQQAVEKYLERGAYPANVEKFLNRPAMPPGVEKFLEGR